MSPRLLAQIIAAGRVAIGATLFASPSLVARGWVGPLEGDRTGTRTMAMGLGARDMVVGAGVLAALAAGNGSAKPWLVGSVVADAMDLAATLRNADNIPASSVVAVGAVAGGAALAGAYVLATIDD